MRVEHFDTPHSKLKLYEVSDKLYKVLKASQCPDLINEELANKINKMSIKVLHNIISIEIFQPRSN